MKIEENLLVNRLFTKKKKPIHEDRIGFLSLPEAEAVALEAVVANPSIEALLSKLHSELNRQRWSLYRHQETLPASITIETLENEVKIKKEELKQLEAEEGVLKNELKEKEELLKQLYED